MYIEEKLCRGLDTRPNGARDPPRRMFMQISIWDCISVISVTFLSGKSETEIALNSPKLKVKLCSKKIIECLSRRPSIFILNGRLTKDFPWPGHVRRH